MLLSQGMTFVGLMLITVLAAAPATAAIHESESGSFTAETVLTGMRQPVAMVFLPDGRGLIAERRTAKIQLVDLNRGSAVTVWGRSRCCLRK